MNKQKILAKLTPFANKKTIIIQEQNTNDIVSGIMQAHKQYASEYDKIYKYFIGNSLEDTCYNVWLFLKENCPYWVEPSNFQSLRSPASILEYPKGCDCKSYSLFTNGILDAYRRNENKNFNLYYRFAGYGSKEIEHVFSVVESSNGKNNFWIDAVLPTFDNRKQPIFFKDKKITPMALVAINGFREDRANFKPWQKTGVRREVNYMAGCGCSRIGDDSGGGGGEDLSWLKDVNWAALFDWIGNLFDYKSDGEKRKEVFDAKGTSIDNIAKYYMTDRSFGFGSDWNLNEFHELYGNKAEEQGLGWTNRLNEVYTSTAKKFNAIINKYIGVGRNDEHEFRKLLIDLSVTKPDKQNPKPPDPNNPNNPTPSDEKKSILPLIGLGLLAKFLIFK